jgi:hypothetical protein
VAFAAHARIARLKRASNRPPTRVLEAPILAHAAISPRCPVRASETTRRTSIESVLQAPVEDNLGDLGAMSGYRVLERADGLPRWRPGSAVPGAQDDASAMPNSRAR